MPGEGRVAFLADADDLGRPAREQPGEVAGAHAVHGVGDDLEASVAHIGQVDQLVDPGQVGVGRVEQTNPAAVDQRVQRLTLHRVVRVDPLDPLFHRRDDLRRGRSAVVRLDLEAVVGARIVAGRNDHATAGLLVDDRERDHRRWDRPVGQQDRQAVGRGDLGGRGGEAFGGEAGVVANHQPGRGLALLLEVVGHRLRADPDVGVGVVLGDDGAPAIGPELDSAAAGHEYLFRRTPALAGQRSARVVVNPYCTPPYHGGCPVRPYLRALPPERARRRAHLAGSQSVESPLASRTAPVPCDSQPLAVERPMGRTGPGRARPVCRPGSAPGADRAPAGW